VLDLFGQYVTLTHENEFTFNSPLGGFFTIIFVVIVFSYGLAEFIPVASRDIKNIRMLDELLKIDCVDKEDCKSFEIKKE
jgi:hypothetical protein